MNAQYIYCEVRQQLSWQDTIVTFTLNTFFCFPIKLQNENKVESLLFQTALVTSHRNRLEGMSTLRVEASRWSSCSVLPSWLLASLYSTQTSLKNPTQDWNAPAGQVCSRFPQEHFKKKKKIKKNEKRYTVIIFAMSFERGMDFTLKPSLLCDLPTVFDFLMLMARLKRRFSHYCSQCNTHFFWLWKHADLFTFIASVTN